MKKKKCLKQRYCTIISSYIIYLYFQKSHLSLNFLFCQCNKITQVSQANDCLIFCSILSQFGQATSKLVCRFKGYSYTLCQMNSKNTLKRTGCNTTFIAHRQHIGGPPCRYADISNILSTIAMNVRLVFCYSSLFYLYDDYLRYDQIKLLAAIALQKSSCHHLSKYNHQKDV